MSKSRPEAVSVSSAGHLKYKVSQIQELQSTDPLVEAIRYKDVKQIAMRLDELKEMTGQAPNLNKIFFGNKPIFFEVMRAGVEKIRFFIDFSKEQASIEGVTAEQILDLNATDEFGNSILNLVATSGNYNIVKLLLENKADANLVNKIGYAPIHGAAVKSHNAVVKLLLEHNANPNVILERDNYQEAAQVTPLHYAILNKNLEMVRDLMEAGANFLIDYIDTAGGEEIVYSTEEMCEGDKEAEELYNLIKTVRTAQQEKRASSLSSSSPSSSVVIIKDSSEPPHSGSVVNAPHFSSTKGSFTSSEVESNRLRKPDTLLATNMQEQSAIKSFSAKTEYSSSSNPNNMASDNSASSSLSSSGYSDSRQQGVDDLAKQLLTLSIAGIVAVSTSLASSSEANVGSLGAGSDKLKKTATLSSQKTQGKLQPNYHYYPDNTSGHSEGSRLPNSDNSLANYGAVGPISERLLKAREKEVIAKVSPAPNKEGKARSKNGFAKSNLAKSNTPYSVPTSNQYQSSESHVQRFLTSRDKRTKQPDPPKG